MDALYILDKLSEVARSSLLEDKMKVVFSQARECDEGFIEALKELSSAFRVSIAKDRRLIDELEALREQGDALKPLEYMTEMVARDFARVRILEQLLADAHVGMRLKDAYTYEIADSLPSLSDKLPNSINIFSKTIISRDGKVQSYSGLILTNIHTKGSGRPPLPNNTTRGQKRKAVAPTSTQSFNASQLSGTVTSTYADPFNTSEVSRADHPRTRASAKTPKRAAFTSAGVPVSYHNLGPPSHVCRSCNAQMWYEERKNKGNKDVNPTFSLCCQEGKVLLLKFKDTPTSLDKLLNFNDPGTSKFRDQIRVYNGIICFTSFGARIDHSINTGRGLYTFRINGQNYHRIGSILLAPGSQQGYAQLYFFNTNNEVRNRMSAFLDTETGQGVDPTIVAGLMDMLDQKNAVAQSFRMARDWCHSHELVNFELRLLSDRTSARQYNASTVSEVADLITNDFRDGIPLRDIVVDNKDEGPKRISELHPSYMALQYPLLFPYEEDGGGRLYQQFLVDAFTAVEEQRLKWTRNNQDSLQVDLYYNLNDAFTRGDTNAKGRGKRIVLPRTFTGGPRYMMQNYQDEMALCRAYRNPDLFITFTSNPKWPKIAEMLSFIPGQKPYERPKVDNIISAEMPSPTNDPEGYKVVTEFMLHGPCGKGSACTVDGKCSKKYPKPFYPETNLDEDGYPVYRRRDSKIQAVKGKFTYDNKYVVPYNRYLLIKYQAHINVEWCNRSKAIKYLFKYLNKGSNRATFVIQENVQNGPLGELQKAIEAMRRNLGTIIELPRPNPTLLTKLDNRLIREAMDFDIKESNLEHRLQSLLNPEHHAIYEDVIQVDRIEVRGPIHGVEVQLGMGEFRTGLGMLIQVKQDRSSATTATMQAQENGVALDEQQLLFLVDVDEQPVQDLALNVDNVFQADDYDAFNSDVDEAPTAQTMFMANLSSADPVNDEAGPSYDSDILSEVHDHDHYQAAICEHHEEHAMHDNVQLNHVVDSHADDTNDSNMIPHAQFELTEREQKINEQLRLVISDRNFNEETLKKELHSVKLQLASTINHNKLVVEEVTSLKKDFKQIENKYLEDFLGMKSLKEKVDDRLFKQDQSLQTVHMLCRPKPYYNELNKVAIGYKNPLRLTRAKQVQHALYNGHEIIKDNHVSAIVHNTEDTLEIDEITRRKMNDKMKDPKYVTHKVKIAQHDYSKENFLATFTPQKQFTPEQIYWSQDLIKMKSKALKEQTTVSRPIKALTVYPPNTPATLVPRVLPTKSQAKIHIFTLI
nr:helicase [Tanacetum cinerariifolium]